MACWAGCCAALLLGCAAGCVTGCKGPTEQGAPLRAGEHAYALSGQVIEVHPAAGAVVMDHGPAGRLALGRDELRLRDASLAHIGDLQPGDVISARLVVGADGAKVLDEVLVHTVAPLPER